MELEEEMEVGLFERANRKITLINQGVLLHKRAGQIMEMVQKIQEEMAVVEEDVAGVIHIGSGETQAFRARAASLHDLIEQYPCVHFHLYSGNAEDVMERLDKELWDFGLFIELYDVTRYRAIPSFEKGKPCVRPKPS